MFKWGSLGHWHEVREEYLAPVPENERSDLIKAYHKLLHSSDEAIRLKAAKAWAKWEWALGSWFFFESNNRLTGFFPPMLGCGHLSWMLIQNRLLMLKKISSLCEPGQYIYLFVLPNKCLSSCLLVPLHASKTISSLMRSETLFFLV